MANKQRRRIEREIFMKEKEMSSFAVVTGNTPIIRVVDFWKTGLLTKNCKEFRSSSYT